MWPRESNARVVLWGSLLLGVALKARLVFGDDGINWPDEIYQSFEPAHRLVYGHGLVAWEFLEGARTWAVPGFVAVWLWVGRLFGADTPSTYIPLVKLVFVAVSGAASLGVYRLARGFGARELESAVASALWSLCALSLYFAPRAMSENLAAPLVVWGLALVFEEAASRRGRIIGAALLGAATIVRLQCAVLCAGVVVALLVPLLRDRALWGPRFKQLALGAGAGAALVVLAQLAKPRDALQAAQAAAGGRAWWDWATLLGLAAAVSFGVATVVSVLRVAWRRGRSDERAKAGSKRDEKESKQDEKERARAGSKRDEESATALRAQTGEQRDEKEGGSAEPGANGDGNAGADVNARRDEKAGGSAEPGTNGDGNAGADVSARRDEKAGGSAEPGANGDGNARADLNARRDEKASARGARRDGRASPKVASAHSAQGEQPSGARERAGALVAVVLTLVASAAVLGLWDAVAWHSLPSAKAGGLFHSAVVYWRFNIVENRGAGWGTAPWTYFFQHLYSTMPGVALVLGAGLLLSAKRAWSVLLTLGLWLALHLFVAHKELRFMLPVMPVVCALFGVALVGFPQQPARLAMAVAGVCVAVSALNHRTLTMGDVGSYPERAASSAWDDFGPVNRLMLAASKQGDVCGLRIDAAHLAWTGGTTYLHAKAPLYMPGYPQQLGHFNYVITRGGSGAPVVASEAGLELVKLGTSCVPDPAYSWRLP